MGCQQGKQREAVLPRSVRQPLSQQRIPLKAVDQQYQRQQRVSLLQPPVTTNEIKRNEYRQKTDVILQQPNEFWVYNPNIEKKLKVPRLISADINKIWVRRGSQKFITVKSNSVNERIPEDKTQ